MLKKKLDLINPGEREFLKYFIITIIMMLFVIAYVWQNIEVVKMKLDYRKTLEFEKDLVKSNDKILYEIEKYRRLESVEEFAGANDMSLLKPDDFATIIIE